MSHHLTVYHQGKTCSLVITLSVLVPEDGEDMTTITDTVQTEVVPFVLRHERVYHDTAIQLWAESADSRNHQVIERRMVIIATALTVSHQPCTVGLIKILSDIGTATVVL